MKEHGKPLFVKKKLQRIKDKGDNSKYLRTRTVQMIFYNKKRKDLWKSKFKIIGRQTREKKWRTNHSKKKRVRSSHFNLHEQWYQIPTLLRGVLPICFEYGIMDTKNNLDKLLNICAIYLIEHDDLMVRLFLQTLVVPTYD
jgi:hypothetical protein